MIKLFATKGSLPVKIISGILTGAVALSALGIYLGTGGQFLHASDHDDGAVDTKGQNLNLTDLYVFREGDQNPNASSQDLVLIMNTNPRSLARQQYFFSTRARYEFNIARVNDNNATPTGKPDVTLRFEFGAPNAQQMQPVTITAIRDGQTYRTKAMTTPLGQASQGHKVQMGNTPFQFFAGLREDPFFFDVEQFFRVRAGALGKGPAVGFRDPSQALDFAKGYNVNAIAIRLPIQWLQGNKPVKTFDVWETISLPKGPGQGNGQYQQVERLARPGINEGLVVTNDFLNALNQVGPDFEAAALAGQPDAAKAAGPIVTEAIQTLKAIGNDDQRAQTLIGAFLPDVMRIDTSGESGYGNALNDKGSPIRGRRLKDDVIDTTLAVLTNGGITTDNVSYEGTPGNPGQGHQPLSPQFPYLAQPN
jgi:hypothetical protein